MLSDSDKINGEDMRIIEINLCIECPYYIKTFPDTHWCKHKNLSDGDNYVLLGDGTIPKVCPLIEVTKQYVVKDK